MNFRSYISHLQPTIDIQDLLRHQLLWVLLLRVILYTLLLGITFILHSDRFNIIFLPTDLYILLILAVYLSSIGSSFLLLSRIVNLPRFGFIQILIDTIFASILVFHTGASQSIFSSIFFFPIIAGGLILPRKGGLIAAAAATLQYGIILLLEFFNILPDYFETFAFTPEQNLLPIANHFAALGLTFFLAAILSALFGIRLRSTENALSNTIQDFDQLSLLYKQIFDNIATGIITIDGFGTITSANNATMNITGYSQRELIGRKLSNMFPTINFDKNSSRLSTTLTHKKGRKIRVGYSHAVLEKLPATDAQDSLEQLSKAGKIVTIKDISEIEELEKQIRQAEKLAAIGMMSAGIAHDFRNPLTAILGSAQVLAEEYGNASPEENTNLALTNIILRESDHMIGTISDFLKFARPETANREWFSLRSCLDEVLEVCQADPAWPATCTVNISSDKNIDVWADQRHLFTIMSQLLQNAINFCPLGNEILDIEATEVTLPNGDAEVVISVSDNGRGVDPADRKKLFEPFFTTRADGTGLGLAIVKQIVEEHHGVIRLEESDSGGAKFIVHLPLA